MANQQIDNIEDINEAINPITPTINGQEGLEMLGHNRNQSVILSRFSRSFFKVYSHLISLYLSIKNLGQNKLDKGGYDGTALELKNWLVTNYTTLMNNIRDTLTNSINTKLPHGGYNQSAQTLKNEIDTKVFKNSININTSVDFNNFETSGFYNVYKASGVIFTNAPNNNFDYGTLLVIGQGKAGASFVTQIATRRDTGLTYIRTRNDGSMAWTNWVSMYGTNNKPSKADVGLGSVSNFPITSAINEPSHSFYATAGAVKKAYDLANGAHEQKVAKSGDTMTGDLKIPNNALTAKSISSSTTVWAEERVHSVGTLTSGGNASIGGSISANGVNINGNLTLNTNTGEKIIGSSQRCGMYLNSGGVGWFDWANNRSILGYDASSGNINISAPITMTNMFTFNGLINFNSRKSSDYYMEMLPSGDANPSGSKNLIRKMRGGENDTIWHESVQGSTYRLATGSTDSDAQLTLSGGNLAIPNNITSRGNSVVTGVRLGTIISRQVWNSSQSTTEDKGYVTVAVRNHNADEIVDSEYRRPLQVLVNGSWVTVSTI